ncbi:glycosyltransferase family 2 protein [Paenibacillus apiarius]|uniref:glycosyltransferase family 2 protein n=1 Tax=Paenibacillus apiarius TaxID=46240 RepID=UPI00300C82A6
MKFDIVLVSYNSEKWIEKCLVSLERLNYPLSHIYISIVDNQSTDRSRELIENYSNKHLFGSYQYHLLDQNIGFGRANNYAVQNTKQDFIFFLNIDTELLEDALKEMSIAIETSGDMTGLWECRQFPYEHPKIYNPVTLEVSWASAAACVVRRDYFEKVGMFDEKIFMYAEDVDLSWRLRAHGYKLQYVPKCVVYHYTYMSAGEVKPNQFYNSTYNNLMLRYKYGTWRDILKGYMLYKSLFVIKGPSRNHKRIIISNWIRSFVDGMKFREWKRKHSNLKYKPEFKVWDYEIIRDGSFYVNERPSKSPLVSLLIRTCGRPNILREALISVRNQTYNNIEVIIVEDGPNISEEMLKVEFNDLNYKYCSTNEKVGRCIAGNIAMEMAKGEYFNFLDDDDLFYADHVETLVSQIQKNPDYKVVYSIAFEVPTKVISTNPYKYKELFHNVQHRQPFNRLLLLHHNYFPIQTVMFEQSIYKELGGMDPELEVLEDWDLWLRYALKHEFLFVEKLTSLYRVPAEIMNAHERQLLFDKYLNIVRNKHFYDKTELTTGEIFKDAQNIIERTHRVFNNNDTITAVEIIKRKIKAKLFNLLRRN